MRSFPAAYVLAPWLGALALVASCGTDARGIEDCRAIENARCEAANACGSIDDVAACKRFYRDQCLHGLSVPAPGGPTTDACVAAIHQIGECARASADTTVVACSRFRTPTRACSFVPEPQLLEECNFLTPNVPPAAEGGAGGEAATSGGTSGGSDTNTSGGTRANGGTATSGGAFTLQGGAPAAQGGAPGGEGGSPPAAEGGSSGMAGSGMAGESTGATGGAGGVEGGG